MQSDISYEVLEEFLDSHWTNLRAVSSRLPDADEQFDAEALETETVVQQAILVRELNSHHFGDRYPLGPTGRYRRNGFKKDYL